MGWLVDENVPKDVVGWLVELGEDVLDVADSVYRGQADRHLWQLAGRQGRLVVTRDRGSLSPAAFPLPVGVIIVCLPQWWQADSVSRLVASALQALGCSSLVGMITKVEPGRTRQRLLSEVPEH